MDDHQSLLARELTGRDLAVTPRVADLALGVLEDAASRSVERVAAPPPFHLDQARPRGRLAIGA